MYTLQECYILNLVVLYQCTADSVCTCSTLLNWNLNLPCSLILPLAFALVFLGRGYKLFKSNNEQ